MPVTVRPVTCAVVHPDNQLRRRIREWLEMADDVEVVGEARDEQGARDLVAARRPRVLLAALDTLDGARGVAHIAASFPETRLLILHREGGRDAVLEALRRGAWGHLPEEALHSEEIVEAVRTVARGEAYMSPTVAGWVVEEVARRLRKR